MLKKAKAQAASERANNAQSAGAAKDEQAGSVMDLSERILESSRQIWLAGLGAFARAQAEGSKVFESLVHQGEALETRTKRAAVDKAAAARDGARAKAKEVQAIAGGTWDKLEQVFERRVERALSKLGVHTQSDVQRLTERVEELSVAVNDLIRITGVKPRASARKSQGPTAVSAAATADRSDNTARGEGTLPTEASAGKKKSKAARKTIRRARKSARTATK
ncbi:MAG TPA: phasin family protein [Casimicrobiaceae bacterium]|nr:phasin family protein [Casimicrobiaceae bacterium]